MILLAVAWAEPLACAQARLLAAKAPEARRAQATAMAESLCAEAAPPTWAYAPDPAPPSDPASPTDPDRRRVVAVIQPALPAARAPAGAACADLDAVRALGLETTFFRARLSDCTARPASPAGALTPVTRWTFRAAKVTSDYGWRRHPIHRRRQFHHGLDLAAKQGEPIPALAAGTVTWAGDRDDGYGKVVEVQHASGAMSRYGHNDVLLVAAGDEVVLGQAIAEAGSTGLSTGPHVHLEVRLDGRSVDPWPYVRHPERLQKSEDGP